MTAFRCKRVFSWRVLVIAIVVSVAYFALRLNEISKFRSDTDQHKNINEDVHMQKIQQMSKRKDDVTEDENEHQNKIANTFEQPEQQHLKYSSPRQTGFGDGKFGKSTISVINETTFDLALKLKQLTSVSVKEHSRTCNLETIGNSCNASACLQLQLPQNVYSRVRQILEPSHLQISATTKKALAYMADQVPGYFELIIVSAASSNHIGQAQAMIYSLHKNVFPHLNNFTFIFYDLGFTDTQRQLLTKICKCKLVDFPFHLFPTFVGFLKCYTWKPLIINAHISRAKLLMWMDSSIRFYSDPSKTFSILDRAKNLGLVIGGGKNKIPHFTNTSMFHFFGDEACAYLPYSQCLCAFAIFHNEPFVRRAILEPWTACALNRDCMCPPLEDNVLKEIRISCHSRRSSYHYGACHRFDQAAMSILLTKLYQEKIQNVALDNIRDFVDIQRADKMDFVGIQRADEIVNNV